MASTLYQVACFSRIRGNNSYVYRLFYLHPYTEMVYLKVSTAEPWMHILRKSIIRLIISNSLDLS